MMIHSFGDDDGDGDDDGYDGCACASSPVRPSVRVPDRRTNETTKTRDPTRLGLCYENRRYAPDSVLFTYMGKQYEIPTSACVGFVAQWMEEWMEERLTLLVYRRMIQ